ncbi:hypothetical protein QAD02_017177 [Eretmocerus hayati]|uniref:Uncharacterized protein n=1 Tax=Eretmocerus hayati TaxID=131215 RepID=A0ACC2PHZ0_9HYME|nr:hypothetical protein QAD02_017177 [Eretmocerus hayati]
MLCDSQAIALRGMRKILAPIGACDSLEGRENPQTPVRYYLPLQALVPYRTSCGSPVHESMKVFGGIKAKQTHYEPLSQPFPEAPSTQAAKIRARERGSLAESRRLCLEEIESRWRELDDRYVHLLKLYLFQARSALSGRVARWDLRVPTELREPIHFL